MLSGVIKARTISIPNGLESDRSIALSGLTFKLARKRLVWPLLCILIFAPVMIIPLDVLLFFNNLLSITCGVIAVSLVISLVFLVILQAVRITKKIINKKYKNLWIEIIIQLFNFQFLIVIHRLFYLNFFLTPTFFWLSLQTH